MTRHQRHSGRVFAALGLGWLLGMQALEPTEADVPESQRAEVEHLLGFIAASTCALVRNGREYNGERAYRHVLRKYDYFRDEIESTEDFIALAASRSELTKRPYEFRCPGEPAAASADVLRAELARLRSTAADRGDH